MKKNYITEQFYSIQGEGRSLGRPAYFIRFAGCNLRCGWCDTLYSVEPKLYRGKASPIDYELVPAHCRLVVLTGGEPTLFDLPAVRERLLADCPERVFEVESNGTSLPPSYADDFIWNLSPKLKSSCQKNALYDRKRLLNLGAWADYGRERDNVSFKFVVSDAADHAEVLALLDEHCIPRAKVYVMAEGTQGACQQLEKVDEHIAFCLREGLNYTPRLHVILWGDKRGV